MTAVSRTIASICLVLVAFDLAHSQGWQGIRPLHSSCAEAQLALGISECVNKTYELKDATVYLTFSDGTCLSEWKVAPGTVLSFDVRPKPAVRFVDLRVDERKFRKVTDQHDPNIVYYKNYDEGLSILVLADGMVGSLSYGPSARDEDLRCPKESLDQEQHSGDTGYWKIDEYGPISNKEAEGRLDQLALQMRARPSAKAYIIAYGGVTTWSGEAKDRAACVKDYLVKNQGIDECRITTVDGGYQREPVVSLFIGEDNATPPSASPTVDASKVRVTTNHRPKDQRRACGTLNK